jgi:hypothetical protein
MNDNLPRAPSEQEAFLRNVRNRLLTLSDWTQLADVDLTVEEKNQWKEYRQSLRDITLDPDFPSRVTWPVQPK